MPERDETEFEDLMLEKPVPMDCEHRPAEATVAKPQEPKFIFAATQKRGRVTVHLFRGGCFRRPGLELKSVTYGNVIDDYDLESRCKDCFKLGKRTAASQLLPGLKSSKVRVDEDSDSSADESSSTEPGND
jgi:hypothetical protein